MRIGPASVNLFFKENRCNVTVWLGCEQLAGIFGNYWLFIVFQRYKSGKKKRTRRSFCVSPPVWAYL
ncbi:hypothetical protein CJ738_07535 [Klebsiella pneumoniae]|nr:hypothetical protein CJ738_07535 [Klebsiella pneumoniae]